MLRKQIIESNKSALASITSGIDVAASATVLVTSESPDHPVDRIFDGLTGPGATRWIAAESGEQTLILAFDAPQSLQEIAVEVEETGVARTQEIVVSTSSDGGRTYRECLRQEYNFSPSGATFEREVWALRAAGVSHFRLVITPDKSGKPCKATLTSLVLR